MAEPIDLGVSPPTSYLLLKPGTTSTHLVTLEQKGDLTLEITPSLVDFTSDGSSGQPILSTESTFRYAKLTLPASSQAETSQASFLLPANQKKSVLVTFTIPESAEEKEYPLTLLFRAKPYNAFSIGDGQSEVNAVVGTNIIALISSTESDQSEISLEEISSPRLIDSLMPLTFTLKVHNNGKNASTIEGQAEIVDWNGDAISEYEFYPDMVLANTSRDVRTATSLEEAADDPSIITSLFTYKAPFLLGKYTITAKTNDSLVSQSVVALPFSFLFILFVLIGVWFFYSFLSTKYKSQTQII